MASPAPAKRQSSDTLHIEKEFIPKKKVIVQIGRTNLYVYPTVTADMTDDERSLAFNINKTALQNARSIPYDQKINHMGELLGCSNLIDIERSVFKNAAFDFLKQNSNLTLASYHNAQGIIVNDALDAAGNLKPVQDGPINTCRPDNIFFAKIRSTVNLAGIDPSITTIPTIFFIRLPTNGQVIHNAAGNPRTLNTFDGPSDWLTIDQQIFEHIIYGHADSIHEPFDLRAPDFTSPEAIPDRESRVNKIEEDVSKAAWTALLSKILRQVCPNFLNDPYKTLSQVHQVTTIKGESITQTVRQYHDQIQLVISTFDKSLPSWPANPFRTFMDNLSPEIKTKVEQNSFRLHTQTVSTSPHDQINLIQQGYEAASLAERALADNRNFIRQELSSAHGFMAFSPTSDGDSKARTLLSPAESTLSEKYQKACAGCGDPNHVFYDKKTKTIVCPKKDIPEVAARAASWLKDFRERAKQRRNQRSKSSRSLLTQLLSQLKQGGISLPETPAADPASNTVSLVSTIALAASGNLPQMPIQVYPTLPHIDLKLGTSESDFQPSIAVIVDSGSCLCTGNSDYIMAIAKAYPQLVKSITLAGDRYSPIILSGVVSDDEDKHNYSTSLPCVVEFHMPYITSAGSPTTLKIACGKQVGVNALIGMSFMTAAKLVVDLNDNVIESKLLNCAPFPLVFKRPSKSMPNLVPITGNRAEKSLLVINAIEQAEAFLNNTPQQQPEQIKPTSEVQPNHKVTIKAATSHDIIRVPKSPGKSKRPTTYKDQNLPDINSDFEFLHQTSVGNVIRKSTQPSFTDNDCNPAFTSIEFDPERDQAYLDKNLQIGDHVPPEIKQRIINLVKKFWCTFYEENVKIPITGYECVIDTGDARPTVARNIRYGIHETPIMQQAINALLANDQICVDVDSSWLSKVVLAPKPHQEEVTNISDFIWRFCVNYIAVNHVTRIWSYFIPRCDDAVEHGFGRASIFFLLDAFSGYHQIRMEENSSKKTAFAGPLGRKYRYLVMPFGLANAPTVYTIMIYDLKDNWDDEAAVKFYLHVDESNNTTIIIDDTFGFVTSYDNGLNYLEAILTIARRHSLSWKLKKCFIFPNEVEFVGHDLTKEGNLPAGSKSTLLSSWPSPTIIRDISSFIGFGNFYSRYIPYFEQRIQHMRKLIRENDYNHKLAPNEWTPESDSEFQDIRNAILSKPLLKRVSRSKRLYLGTDFSKIGMGFWTAQPGDDEESLLAMKEEDAGGVCKFDLTIHGLRLFPCSFGSRSCFPNEEFLHSYVGEAKALQYGVKKNHHLCYGRPFTNIGDCIGIRWIMFYNGNNPVIKRIQLELMGWWMTIVHRPRRMNIAPDYFSKLGTEFHYDPLLNKYQKIAEDNRKHHPPEATGPSIDDQNLPNFRGNRTTSSTPQAATFGQATPTTTHLVLASHESLNTASITNIPINFGRETQSTKTKPLHQSTCCNAAFQLLNQNWIVYGFNSGHFFKSCHEASETITVTMAADPDEKGRSFFKSFGKVKTILASSIELLHHIRSKYNTPTQGYFISGPQTFETKRQINFLTIQSTIIQELRSKCHLQAFVIHLPPQFSKAIIRKFGTSITEWSITLEHVEFNTFGDCIDSSANIIFGIHTGVTGEKISVPFIRPPQTPTCIEDHIYKPFDDDKFTMSQHPSASPEEIDGDAFSIQNPTPQASTIYGHHVQYHLIRKSDTPSTLVGTKVCHRSGSAPPLEQPNFNPFRRLFGVTFKDSDDRDKIRIISPYEYCQCWNMDRNLIIDFARTVANTDLLSTALPGNTSAAIMEAVLSTLTAIRLNQSTFLDSTTPTAAAATAHTFLSGVTILKLPSNETWKEAYKDDEETNLIINMIRNPSLIKKENLEKIHYVYRQPVRDNKIKLLDGLLFIQESIDIRSNFIQLQIVPTKLRNLVFTAFHANPIGEHFDLYHTFHKIRLRYFWPHMYKYIDFNIQHCAGCNLTKSRIRKSSSLVYSFPIDQPWMVLHADVYTIGTEQGFSGEKSFMNVLCGMCTFCAVEGLGINDMNSQGFSKAIMKICLTLGLPHTIVIDKDSKFRKTFEETMNLLGINLHVASGGNHDPVLTERFHVFANKSLSLFCNERDSIRVAAEGLQLCKYAWNSAPVVGTDISRSLVCVGREFKFPIEYTANPHVNLSLDPSATISFAQVQQTVLSQSREIFRILIHEHRAWHREYINSRRPDPLIYEVNDLVFARRSVRSDRNKGRVGKIMIKHTGPWRIIEKLAGSSYKLQHCKTSKYDKKHAAHLSPCPEQLIPFPPLSGPDTSYSQIHKQIKKHPFIEAGIESYNPATAWTSEADASESKHPALLSLFASTIHPFEQFPSLADLNDEIAPDIFGEAHPENPHISDRANQEVLAPATSINIDPSAAGPLCMVNIPQPVQKNPHDHIQTNQTTPFDKQAILIKLIQSADKLLFISYSSPYSDQKEWKLVQLDLEQTLNNHPQALHDGKLLVNFLICHPDDKQFNAPNQRYWPEYHELQGRFAVTSTYHLVKPSPNTAQYLRQKSLTPFSQWIQLSTESYIHGPFDFAVINGRKTRDRISRTDWESVLLHDQSTYQNQPPRLNLSSYAYSYHINTQYHTVHHDISVSTRMNAVAMYNYYHEDS